MDIPAAEPRWNSYSMRQCRCGAAMTPVADDRGRRTFNCQDCGRSRRG